MDVRFVDARTLAEYLSVPLTWVWRAGREGLIPCVRVGKYMRFDKELVLESLRKNSVPSHALDKSESEPSILAFRR